MGDIATSEQPLHPLATKCLKAVETKEKGSESAIPPAALAALKAELAAEVRDLDLFVHLVVLGARLQDGGLTAAAAQLFDLARIGLDAQAIEQAKRDEASAKQDREALAKSEEKMKAGSKLTSGLAPKSKPMLSVGMKPAKKS